MIILTQKLKVYNKITMLHLTRWWKIMVYKKRNVLHFALSLEIMVCKKMKVLHLTLIINNCGFLNNKERPQWKHVQDDNGWSSPKI